MSRVTHDASLRLDIELLGHRAPTDLLFANELGGTVRRAGALGGQAERNQSLLNIRTFEVFSDFCKVATISDACRRAQRRQKAVHNDAGQRFVDCGKTRRESFVEVMALRRTFRRR